jgi:putative flippase GtrA
VGSLTRVFSFAAGRMPLRFVAVGCAAAVVHWSVAMAFVAGAGLPPLAANVAGWAVAVSVSFWGHHRLTFGGHGTAAGTAFRRFAVVSAAGFGVNEAAYAMLLHGTAMRADVALALVLAGVAVITYALSRLWAFAGR